MLLYTNYYAQLNANFNLDKMLTLMLTFKHTVQKYFKELHKWNF